MPLTASGAFATAMGGTDMEVAAALTLDLPGLGSLDYTASLKSISFDTQDTTSFPDDLTDKSGYTDTGGSFVLAGAVSPDDETSTWIVLLNPDDPRSSLFRAQVKGSSMTFDFGVRPAGQPKELLRRVTGRVQSYVVDVAAGTVTVQFVDLSGDWDQLPGLPAVIVSEPYSAGLTSEFALDRIARAASGGAVSSWPAQRPQCVLAAGMRSSVWPERGTLDAGGIDLTGIAFVPGAFGSALATSDPLVGAVVDYDLTAPVGTTLFIEGWFRSATDTGSIFVNISDPGGAEVGVTLDVEFAWSLGAPLAADVFIQVAPAGTTFGPFAFTADTAAHYIALAMTVPAVCGHTYTGTLYIDGTSQSIGSPSATPANRVSANWTLAQLVVDGAGSLEALQVSVETSPTPNSAFAPQAVLDPSLNPLQAVPGIEEGASAWDEIQTIVTAEGGYAARDNTGRLVFLNRDTIIDQTPARTIKPGVSLKTLQAQVGATTEYDDIAIDYTEWTYGAATAIFSPTAKWRIAAYSTQTFTRTLPDGATAAITSGLASVLPDGHNPADGGHWYRAARDKFGNVEHGPLTVQIDALTASTVQITVTNPGGYDAWLVTPTNYADRAAGTVALWVGGIPVTPDQPTTVHVSYGDAKPTYTAPPNAYRQDRDAALAFGAFLLDQLHRAKPTYQGVAIVPDARLVVPDKVTVDIPLADGQVETTDVLIWGLSFSADFDSKTWDMSLDIRRVAPPGAWLLGVAGASELGAGSGDNGTAWLY